MNSLQNKSIEIPLRLGLGGMFLYSGYDLIMHPTGWYWALRPLPQALQTLINTGIGKDSYLMFQGAGELVIAALLLMWFLPRWTLKIAALATTIEMAAILLLVGLNLETFRDIGLLGASIALFMSSLKSEIS